MIDEQISEKISDPQYKRIITWTRAELKKAIENGEVFYPVEICPCDEEFSEDCKDSVKNKDKV